MKFNKITVLITSVLLSTSVMAQANTDRELLKPVNTTSKRVIQKADFGSYTVQRNLVSVPKSVASADMVISTEGNMAIVHSDTPIERVTKGTLVKNSLTNEVSSLSGNISVLLKSEVSANDVSEMTGLSLVSAFAGTQIAVFKVTGTQDLIEASKQLRATGLVKVAKIEVLEIMHKAQ